MRVLSLDQQTGSASLPSRNPHPSAQSPPPPCLTTISSHLISVIVLWLVGPRVRADPLTRKRRPPTAVDVVNSASFPLWARRPCLPWLHPWGFGEGALKLQVGEACRGPQSLNSSWPSIPHLLNVFAVAAETKSHRLGGWNNRNVFSPSPRGW